VSGLLAETLEWGEALVRAACSGAQAQFTAQLVVLPLRPVWRAMAEHEESTHRQEYITTIEYTSAEQKQELERLREEKKEIQKASGVDDGMLAASDQQ
jgi:hypothetical protein